MDGGNGGNAGAIATHSWIEYRGHQTWQGWDAYPEHDSGDGRNTTDLKVAPFHPNATAGRQWLRTYDVEVGTDASTILALNCGADRKTTCP